MKTALKLLVLIPFLLIFSSPSMVKADVSCTASVSPSSSDINSNPELNFSVTNDGSNNIDWVKITRPTGDFTITGSNSDYTYDKNDSDITFTGFNIRPGNAPSFSVVTAFGGNPTGSESWQVTASENGGTDTGVCGGNTGVSITSPNPTSPPAPQLVSITLSDLTADSIKISWVTDQSTDSKVSYGTTSSLGTDVTSANQVTDHSFDLSGLSPETTYYYQVISSNSYGTTESSPNYFTTYAGAFMGPTPTPVSVPVTNTITTTVTNTNTVIKTIVVEVKDTTAPTIAFIGKYENKYQKAPEFTGYASDDTGVGRIDYSVDGGNNWLPVDSFKNLGQKKANFNFIPLVLEDGNYSIKARAFDPAGNIGYTNTLKLIIDRLPPQVGGALISIGPQILEPNSRGETVILPGLPAKITLSAIGGATGIKIILPNQEFPLTEDPDSGLWSGILSFKDSGVYQLSAKSVDGAGNITDQQLNSVRVLPEGIINSQGLGQAVVSAFVFEPLSGQYVLWDGIPYGQVNPQNLDNSGNYHFFLPQGRYYLEMKAPQAATLRTSIFELAGATPINYNFQLEKKRQLRIGPFFFGLPELFDQIINFQPNQVNLDLNNNAESLLSKSLPFFSLSSDGTTFSSTTITGKPSIITLLNTWWPDAVQQLNYLEALSANPGLGILVITPQESLSKISVFKKKGNYSIPIIADPDGTVVEPLTYWSVPTHLFVDRHGVILKIKRGILNQQEILDNITE